MKRNEKCFILDLVDSVFFLLFRSSVEQLILNRLIKLTGKQIYPNLFAGKFLLSSKKPIIKSIRKSINQIVHQSNHSIHQSANQLIIWSFNERISKQAISSVKHSLFKPACQVHYLQIFRNSTTLFAFHKSKICIFSCAELAFKKGYKVIGMQAYGKCVLHLQ